MLIHGLQKMTLLDYPGKVACTVFLGGCDFRCPFCHNSELLDGTADAVMDDGELLAFLEKRRGLLDGVAITGGEPTLRPDLPQLLEKIKALGYPVKLDSNGNHPAVLRALIRGGLVDYIAMDIKNSPERYAETAGVSHFDLAPIEESIALLLTDKVDYEFRTTTVAELHDADSFRKIGPWLKGAKRYFLQPFTDRDTVAVAGFHAPGEDELRRYADLVRPFVREVAIRGL